MGKKKLSRFRFTPFYLLGSLSSPSPRSTVREMIAVWFIGSLERPSIYTQVYNTHAYIYIIYSTREASRFDLLLFDSNRETWGAGAVLIRRIIFKTTPAKFSGIILLRQYRNIPGYIRV